MSIMNSKLANVFLSFLLPAMLLTGCSELTTNNNEYITNESEKPLYLELGNTQTDSLNAIKYSQLATDGFKLFCGGDDFTVIPNWSTYEGQPMRSIASIDFSYIYLTFDDKERLQRLLLVEDVETEDVQKQVYDKAKEYLDQNYSQIKSHPLRTLNMTTNEVIRSEGDNSYTGWVSYDVVSYKTKDGYISINKGLVGEVLPPSNIRPSTNGLYIEYISLGKELPQWKNEDSKFLDVKIRHFPNVFSDMYDKKCS